MIATAVTSEVHAWLCVSGISPPTPNSRVSGFPPNVAAVASLRAFEGEG